VILCWLVENVTYFRRTDNECETFIGGMMIVRESQSPQRVTCPSVTLSISYLTWTALGLNTGLRVKKPESEVG